MSTTATAPGDSPRRHRANSPAIVVARSGLPPELRDLVLAVTDKCRLWQSERTDVARELCGHFQDGLEAGESPTDIAAAFGDPAHAASLITPAKKRLRPLWWRASRQSLRGIAATLTLIVLLYALAAARYFFGSPTIAHNYTAEMNAPILATPVSERAWPRYIEAMHEFGLEPEVIYNDPVPEKPGDPTWGDYAAWLKSKDKAFAIMRDAATRPQMGFVLRNDLEPELVRVLEARRPEYKHHPAPEVENPLLIGVLLPHLGEMRRMARFTSADAMVAAEEGDRVRFVADIDAMLGMGEQCMKGPHVITIQVGVAIFDFARHTAEPYITNRQLLTDADLVHLSHRFAGFAGGRLSIDMSAERLTIEDIIQRFYTDDGNGGGYFVASDQTEQIYNDFGLARPKGIVLMKAIQPIQSVRLPSRARLNKLVAEFSAQAVADDAMPPWRHHERRADSIYQEIGRSGMYAATPIIKSLQGGEGTQPLASALASRDLAAARRDALLVVMALELHHRRTGMYPASLQAMVPSYLPSLPRDPMDGQTLRYRPPASKGELPLLYSVGVDGIDDGGTPPTTRGGRYSAGSLSRLKDFRVPRTFTPEERVLMEEAKGDWVLWPELPELPRD